MITDDSVTIYPGNTVLITIIYTVHRERETDRERQRQREGHRAGCETCIGSSLDWSSMSPQPFIYCNSRLQPNMTVVNSYHKILPNLSNWQFFLLFFSHGTVTLKSKLINKINPPFYMKETSALKLSNISSTWRLYDGTLYAMYTAS